MKGDAVHQLVKEPSVTGNAREKARERQARFRMDQACLGLRRVDVWVGDADLAELLEYAQELRARQMRRMVGF